MSWKASEPTREKTPSWGVDGGESPNREKKKKAPAGGQDTMHQENHGTETTLKTEGK